MKKAKIYDEFLTVKPVRPLPPLPRRGTPYDGFTSAYQETTALLDEKKPHKRRQATMGKTKQMGTLPQKTQAEQAGWKLSRRYRGKKLRYAHKFVKS